MLLYQHHITFKCEECGNEGGAASGSPDPFPVYTVGDKSTCIECRKQSAVILSVRPAMNYDTDTGYVAGA